MQPLIWTYLQNRIIHNVLRVRDYFHCSRAYLPSVPRCDARPPVMMCMNNYLFIVQLYLLVHANGYVLSLIDLLIYSFSHGLRLLKKTRGGILKNWRK